MAKDAPRWFGFAAQEREREEAELPQRFGIQVGAPVRADAVERMRELHSGEPGRPLLTFPVARIETAVADSFVNTRDLLEFHARVAKKPIAILSLVGGVGGTSLAAGLARILANCGERVLLADAGGHTLLPHFFGGKGSRQGLVRRFVPAPGSNNQVISMVSLNVEPFAGNDDEQDRLLCEFDMEASREDRVVWDLGNAPADWVNRILHQNVRVIIPLLPTAKCLMQVSATERLLQRSRRTHSSGRWQFVLNQFDEHEPSHVEIRPLFREKLGDRLLPFVLRRTPLVDEALLRGRTIVDHAPACPLVLDMWRLARSVAGLASAYPKIVPGAWGEK